MWTAPTNAATKLIQDKHTNWDPNTQGERRQRLRDRYILYTNAAVLARIDIQAAS